MIINPSSSLVTKSMFSTTLGLTSQGAAPDYVLDRNTAQFELVTALTAGQSLEAGIENTRAVVTSSIINGASINFPAEGYIWIAVDEPVTVIPTGVTAGSFLTISASGNLVSYKSSTSGAFANVSSGDYVVIWSAEINAANRLEGRVHSMAFARVWSGTLGLSTNSKIAT